MRYFLVIFLIPIIQPQFAEHILQDKSDIDVIINADLTSLACEVISLHVELHRQQPDLARHNRSIGAEGQTDDVPEGQHADQRQNPQDDVVDHGEDLLAPSADLMDRLVLRGPVHGLFLFHHRNAHEMPTPLEHFVVEFLVGDQIGRGDQQEGHHRFQQAHGGGGTKLGLLQAHAVDHGINDVASLIDRRAVQVEHLVKAGVEQIAQVQDDHEDDNGGHPGQSDVPSLLPAVGAVDGGRLIR